MIKNIITKISFLVDDERRYVETNERNGKISLGRSTLNLASKYYSVYDFVTHEKIRERDPVVTLDTGEKFRVYKGGDSKYMMSQVDGLMRKHDGLRVERRKQTLKKGLKRKSKFSLDNPVSGDYSEYGYLGYPIDYSDDDTY